LTLSCKCTLNNVEPLRFYRNLAYIGLGYQTFKGLHALKDHNEKTKDGQVMSRELKENGKKVDDQIVRLIMKWYISFLFM
jgi:hypothetical protein